MFGRRWGKSAGRWDKDIVAEEGDRFFAKSNCGHVWIVDRVFTPPGMPAWHASLHRADREVDRRTISGVVLTDMGAYGRDRREAQIGEPVTYSRRRMDRPLGNVRSTV